MIIECPFPISGPCICPDYQHQAFRKDSTASAVSPQFSGIAIDPGKNGGIAFCVGGEISAVNMPATDMDIADLFRMNDITLLPPTVYLEKLVKHTGRPQPASRMAVYAGNHGVLRGALAAFRYRVVEVAPKDWQEELSLGGSKSHADHTAWKNHLKNRAQQLFPNLKVTKATADALLILEAARRGLIG